MREIPFTRLAGVRRAVAMLLVVALLALATAAHARPSAYANSGPPATQAAPEDVGKLMTYAGCAVGIALATGTAQVYFAVFACARIFFDEVDW